MSALASSDSPNARFPFGLLDQPTREVTFRCGEVRPLAADIYGRLRTWGEAHGHRDGWLYPSTLGWTRSVVAPGGSEIEEDWPANEPKPDVWIFEPTHELIWLHAVDTERHLPAIVINALGWAFGNRVQFADWRMDGRVRWSCSPSFGLRVVHVPYFLDRVVATAEALPTCHVEILNTLILHNRVPMYTWDWERHHWQYVVLDACWRLLNHLGRMPKEAPGGHRARIETMCDRLRIPRLPDVESRIVGQRNELAHQGLWCGGLPGYQGTSDAHYDYFRMRKLADRLLLHVFDIDCGLRTRSWDLGSLVAETMDMSPDVPVDVPPGA